MRTGPARRTALLVAAVTSAALLAAACTGKPDPTPSEADGEGVLGSTNGLELAKGTLLISDGSPRVRIGDAAVTFPSSVTDAVWSPDGSRIAYIDGDGNVATARPDGTDVLVLTTRDPEVVVRSRPTWLRQWILYAEARTDGTSALRSLPANGCAIGDTPATGAEWPMDTGEGTSYIDLAPSASATDRPMRVAFQHEEPNGPEIWINDSNQRVPLTYKVADGSEPALTLDGQKLAYVGRDGDIYVTVPGEAVPGTRVTAGAEHPLRLAWSPDGQYIAYESPAGVQRVSAAGGASAPEDLAVPPGTPSYLYGHENALFPVTGTDPTALSVAASQARWPGPTVFAPGQGYLGAYTATIGLASQPPRPAPYGPLLLLDSPDQLDPRVVAELRRVFGAVPPNYADDMRPQVYVDDQIPASIDEELGRLGYQVRRERPPADEVAAELCPPSDGPALSPELVVVDGADPAAVGIGRAFAGPGPVLVVSGALTDEQITWLRRSSGVIESVYVIGSVPDDVRRQVAELVAGPLGYTTTHNPVAPAELY